MSPATMALRIEELLKTGLSLEVALAEVMKENTSPKVTDRITWIADIDSISEVRKAIKIAFAKKSKTKSGSGNATTMARYQSEIHAGQEKLNTLLSDVNTAETPWMRAYQLGADAKEFTNFYVIDTEKAVNEALDLLTKDKTNAATKTLVHEQPTTLPNDLPELVKATIAERLKNLDMRIVTLVKKMNLLSTLTPKVEKIEVSEEKEEIKVVKAIRKRKPKTVIA